MAQVEIGGKYGFINKAGEIVINPQFDEAYPFFYDRGLLGDASFKVAQFFLFWSV